MTSPLRRIIGLFVGLAAPFVLSAAPQDTNTLCVMTYNLRYAIGDVGTTNAWANRRPLMHELIAKISPDIFGTQEGLFDQLQDIAKDLPEYGWIGVGRDGGNNGEFSAIFYRKSRFQPMMTNHFWLSDTPEVVASSTWGNSNRRMVTWVKFLDRQTGREFYHFNTHFDHAVQIAREKSAKLVRARVEALHTELPVLFTGDFNADASNKAHELLVGDNFFSDTWDKAAERRGEGLGTFNDFKAVPHDNSRIDWILSRGKVSVQAEEIVTFSKDGRFPSDHCPLVAWIRCEQ